MYYLPRIREEQRITWVLNLQLATVRTKLQLLGCNVFLPSRITDTLIHVLCGPHRESCDVACIQRAA